MKKILVLSLFLTTILAACGSEKEASCEGNAVILVTDSSGIEDKSFNQMNWEGIKQFTKETGTCAKHLIAENTVKYESTLTTATGEGYDLVVASGFTFDSPVTNVALANPNQEYLLIDEVADDENGELLPNVASVVFAENEGSYLAGVAAGLKAKAENQKTLGFIGGQEFPTIIKFETGFIAGVKAVYPEAEVLVEYTGTFVEAEKGKSIASKMYDNGAYIIHVAAGSTGNGVIREAIERVNDGEDVWVVGVDRDQYEEGLIDRGQDEKDLSNKEPVSVILTSMVKRVDVATNYVLTEMHAGKKLGGELLTFDLQRDGVGIPEKNPNLTDEIEKTVEEYKEKIISGEIIVPSER